jgi:hypothetical protein
VLTVISVPVEQYVNPNALVSENTVLKVLDDSDYLKRKAQLNKIRCRCCCSVTGAAGMAGLVSSVVDPKLLLFFPDPVLNSITDPDSDPDCL